jgi:hypothetical protein
MLRAERAVEELKAAITPGAPEPAVKPERSISLVKPKAEEAAPKAPVAKPVEPAPAVTPEKPAPAAKPVEPIAIVEPKAEEAAPKAPPKAVQPEAPAPEKPAMQTWLESKLKQLPQAPDRQASPMESLIVLLIFLGVYVYYSLCLYLIAKKAGVAAAWTAWIPIIQAWTFVASAGKSGWWILLMLVPVINIIVMIYLWMCITENLGKNKFLGLLILLPVINIIYPAFLAFSKPPGRAVSPPDIPQFEP